jgi:hypothetical protein
MNIDWVGSVLFIGALTTLIMGIDFGGVEWQWGNGQSIALFVVSGVLFIVFGVQQTFFIFCNEQTRLFPIHFLKRRSLLLLFILNSESGPAMNFLCFALLTQPSIQRVPAVGCLLRFITSHCFSSSHRSG